MSIYMQVGAVPGTATDTTYPGWIVLQSIQWGLSVDVSTTVGASGNRLSAGKITPSDVHVVKEFDTASVPLMKLAFAGTNTPTATIVVTQQATDDGEAYLQYTLSDVIISSFQVSASDSGKTTDVISINFSKIEIKANPTDETGTKQPSIGGYDFAKANPM
jgi:type VI protein secretion system component Hcp